MDPQIGKRYDELCRRVVRPGVSAAGVGIFTAVWFLLGGAETVMGPDRGDDPLYLPWIEDWLGFYLLVILIIGATLFFFAIRRIEDLALRAHVDIDEHTLRRMRVLFPISFLVALALTIHNVWFVCAGPTAKKWWSHQVLPYAGPALVAGAYYILAVLPLVLALVRLGQMLSEIGQHARPSDLDPLHPDRCFGMSAAGDPIFGSLAFLILWAGIPVFIQAEVHGGWRNVTYASWVLVVVALLLLFHLCIRPAYTLMGGLLRVRRHWEELAIACKDEKLMRRVQKTKVLPLTKRSLVYLALAGASKFIPDALKLLQGLANPE